MWKLRQFLTGRQRWPAVCGYLGAAYRFRERWGKAFRPGDCLDCEQVQGKDCSRPVIGNKDCLDIPNMVLLFSRITLQLP